MAIFDSKAPLVFVDFGKPLDLLEAAHDLHLTTSERPVAFALADCVCDSD